MRKLKNIIWLMLCMATLSVSAQHRRINTDYLYDLDPVAAQDSLHARELHMQQLGDSLIHGSTQKVRLRADSMFIPYFAATLKIPGSFDYPFDSLTWMKRLTPEDRKFRIYNWPLYYTDGTYFYLGAIQMRTDKGLKLIPLRDYTAKLDTNLEQVRLDKDTWLGALYYTIIQNKVKDKTYYTLLGWDGHLISSHRKIIEVLTFDEQGMPVFGAPVFEMDGKTKSRIIFDYSGEANMVVQYIPEYNMISFDHLAPPSGSSNSKVPYYKYVPDGTYDYFAFKKGKWIFQEELFSKFKKPIKEAGQ